jgi:hypothetical protein
VGLRKSAQHFTFTLGVKSMRFNFLMILVIGAVLSGCSVLEYLWLVPRANGEVSFNPAYSNEEILDVFVQLAQPELSGFNAPSESYRNIDEGIIEIGSYQKSNIAGYSAHAEIDHKQHVLTFVVKGAGPYYMALPVDKVIQKIICKLSPRLESKKGP